MLSADESLRPEPMAYHRAMVTHLQSAEPGLWQWFASSRKRLEEAEAIRLNLLKSTYRLEPQAQPKLYELANSARERMGLGCNLTLYQAQTANAMNASLAFVPGEAHVVLSGPLADVLSESELLAVLSHELAHFLLYENDNGVYLTAHDLLRALAADAATRQPASESARLYSLWTEIYADRWAQRICGDRASAIAALLKIETGLNEVSAESYLRQAEEILAKGSAATESLSHPEPYIRARALGLWAEQGGGAQGEIQRMIERGLDLHHLDLLGQTRAEDLTRQFLQTLLRPRWFQTECVLAHAKRFFPDFALPTEPQDESDLKSALEVANSSLGDYLCYLMLDFATVDRELGDVALSAAVVLARRLGIDKRFAELAHKELTLGKKTFAKLDKNAESLLDRTEAAQTS
jgi:Zn-dependent protease with chaperone function